MLVATIMFKLFLVEKCRMDVELGSAFSLIYWMLSPNWFRFHYTRNRWTITVLCVNSKEWHSSSTCDVNDKPTSHNDLEHWPSIFPMATKSPTTTHPRSSRSSALSKTKKKGHRPNRRVLFRVSETSKMLIFFCCCKITGLGVTFGWKEIMGESITNGRNFHHAGRRRI